MIALAAHDLERAVLLCLKGSCTFSCVFDRLFRLAHRSLLLFRVLPGDNGSILVIVVVHLLYD